MFPYHSKISLEKLTFYDYLFITDYIALSHQFSVNTEISGSVGNRVNFVKNYGRFGYLAFANDIHDRPGNEESNLTYI